MNAELFSLISVISYIVAGVCLVLAVFFWFFFKIPSVIGDLSGRTARKSIAKMRQANVKSGNKSYRPSAVNAARGKLTDPIRQTGQPQMAAAPQPPPQSETGRPETGLLYENRAQAHVEATTELLTGNEITTMLVDENATMALDVEAPARRSGGKQLTMLSQVMLIHTDEVI